MGEAQSALSHLVYSTNFLKSYNCGTFVKPGEPTIHVINSSDVVVPLGRQQQPDRNAGPVGCGLGGSQVLIEPPSHPHGQAPHDRGVCPDPQVSSMAEVWWDEEGRYYGGTVKEYNQEHNEHLVKYDDGACEWERLDLTEWQLVSMPSSSMVVQGKRHSSRRERLTH